jgi:hypothetical protein
MSRAENILQDVISTGVFSSRTHALGTSSTVSWYHVLVKRQQAFRNENTNRVIVNDTCYVRMYTRGVTTAGSLTHTVVPRFAVGVHRTMLCTVQESAHN